MLFSPRVPERQVEEVRDLLADSASDIVLLDVRSAEEREYSNIGGLHIPMQELPARLAELDHARAGTLVVYCRSGHRSASAVSWLQARGFEGVVNMQGGINAWSRLVDPSVRAY